MRTGIPFILRGLVFLAIPLIVLEVVVRLTQPVALKGADQLINFYGRAERVAERTPVDYVFVGSSRVAASINDSTFMAEMGQTTGERPVMLKQGKGYSTPAVHYLGLRNLIQENPERMRGVTVFIEAPTGLPDMETWNDEWAKDNWPQLLAPVLRPSDIPRYLAEGSDSKKTKAIAISGSLSSLARYWDFIRNRFTAELKKQMDGAPQEDPNADLTTDGGIRTDSAGIAITIQMARDLTMQIHASERPVEDWNRTIMADIVRLVRSHGGEVVFFDVPISSYGVERYASPARRASAASFQTWAAANGLQFVRVPTFTCDDSDFPDLAHLRKSYAPAFTQQLVAAYTAGVTTPYPDGRLGMCTSPPPTDLIPPRMEEPDGWLEAVLKMFGAVSDDSGDMNDGNVWNDRVGGLEGGE